MSVGGGVIARDHCCAACGYRSAADFFFREANGRTFCGACAPDRTLTTRFVTWICVLGVMAIAWLAAAESGADGGFGYFAAFFAFLGPALLLAAVVHEAGHAAVAWLVGGQVFSIGFGSGRVVRRLVLGHTALELCADPFGGGRVVSHFEEGRWAPWRPMAVVLGGVAANALAGAALLALLVVCIHGGVGLLTVTAISAMATAQFLAVSNLLPYDAAPNMPTDGKLLWGLITSPAARQAWKDQHSALTGLAMARQGGFAEAADYCRRRWEDDRANGLLLSVLIHATGRSVGPSAAVRYGRDVRDALPGETSDRGWAFAYGNLAWHEIMAREPGWEPVVADYSERAHRIIPEEAVIRAVRGAALMLAGDEAAGRKMMDAAIPGIEQDDKAEFCAFLADWETAQGRDREAAEYRSVAQRLRPA